MPHSSADPNALFAIGMQSALGAPQTAATKLRFAKYLSGTDAAPEPDVGDMREGGDGLDFGVSYKRRQVTRGQLVVAARPEIAAQIMQAVPGGASWSGASAPAAHEFHTGHASHPWSTIFMAHPGTSLAHLLSDVRFTGFTLDAQSGEPWRITAPFLAINHGASLALPVPTYYGDDFWLFHSSPTYVIDGVGDTDITGFRVDMALGIEELQAQAITLDEAVVQNRDTNIEITRRYEDATLWKKIHLGAGVAPTTSVPTGSFRARAQYGAGAGLRYFEVNLPLLSYRSNRLTELDPDGRTIIETISAKALKGATHALIAAVGNAHASAYAS